MNTDKAYLLGLIIGGGDFGNAEDVLRIRLPYRKWGSYLGNPQRAGQIARDILQQVGQMFRAVYNLSVQYETSPGGTWVILCEGDTTSLKSDLSQYGIRTEGEVRGNADISLLVADLIDANLKRRFIAGIADTIGSMAKSHRRFTDEHQTISLEIKGYNYHFVCQLCHLLYSINCIPDQVSWNHPNIHCTSDPYYGQWNKGFKLRILLDQYSRFGAFAFRTKAESSNENRRLQQQTHEAERCEARDINVTPSAVHPAEHDARLPEEIRDGHYLHFRHFCAVLGCEHAPYNKISMLLRHPGNYINPFPILHKDTQLEIEHIISRTPLYSARRYTILNMSVFSLLTSFNNDNNTLLYGNSVTTGYPISKIMQAIAYVLADDDELNGRRPAGGYVQVIERHLQRNPELAVEIRRPDLLTPLLIFNNGRGAMIGAENPEVYNRLISICPNNQYKLIVRQITEEDLRNAQG